MDLGKRINDGSIYVYSLSVCVCVTLVEPISDKQAESRWRKPLLRQETGATIDCCSGPDAACFACLMQRLADSIQRDL